MGLSKANLKMDGLETVGAEEFTQMAGITLAGSKMESPTDTA